MKKTILLILLCSGSMLNAQQFETGVILDSIAVTNSNEETFALYLPKGHKPDELSPILFIFSPSANGKKGIETFVKASEAYNYILVCSNNSRNGPFGRNFEIAQGLFNHIFTNFKIRENGVFLAGFSGGSRLAAAIAAVSDKIEGVIACGAGFSSVPSYTPSTQNFSYAGLCGDRDMNYKEMIGVEKYLNQIKFSNTLFTFDGNHEWPPNEQILMALEWLETVAHKKGHLKKSDDEVKASYLKSFERAKIAMNNNQHLSAVAHYERTLNTYGSFFELDSVRQELKSIKKDKAYIGAVKSREKAFKAEEVLTLFFFSRFEKDYEKPEKANLKWWDKELEKLSKQEARADIESQKMIERLRFKVMAMAYERASLNSSKLAENKKVFCKAIVSRFYTKVDK